MIMCEGSELIPAIGHALFACRVAKARDAQQGR